jgi:N-acetylneuraminic acid mutarotase
MKNLSSLPLLLLVLAGMPCLFSCNGDDEPLKGDWKQLADFSGVARAYATSFVIGTKGYLFGGYDGSHRLYDLWEFNTENDTWTQLADFPGNPRAGASAFVIGTNGYVGLGFDGGTCLKDFWEYNSITDTWSQKADFKGSARADAVAFALSGKGYFGCGYDDNFLGDFYSYNPTSDIWENAPAIWGAKRSAATAFVYNNEAYVVGGHCDGKPVISFCKFNPTSQEWIKLNAIYDESDQNFDDNYANLARNYTCVFIIGEYAYMTCGANPFGTSLSDTWEYDFATDRWYRVADFEGGALCGGVTFSIEGRGIILTGQNSSNKFKDVWEFLPDAVKDASN